MTHLYKYSWLLLTFLCLTGCEEMFLREIDFEGEAEPEMLVIDAELDFSQKPAVYLSHSFFFDRKDKQPNAWVTDAQVTMRVNNTWYSLAYADTYGYYSSSELPWLKPRDTVEIVASHPKYETARATQVMPGQIVSYVDSYGFDANYWLNVTLDFPAYRGNEDDVIGLSAYAKVAAPQRLTQRVDTLIFNTIYSSDIVFSQAQNQEAEGYYGAQQERLLYFPSAALSQPRKLSFFLDRYWSQQNKQKYKSLQILQLDIRVYALTHDSYLFVKSQERNSYIYKLPVPSGLPSNDGNIMEDIMDELKEALGQQEPIRVYSNIEGGLGIVMGVSRDIHTLPLNQ